HQLVAAAGEGAGADHHVHVAVVVEIGPGGGPALLVVGQVHGRRHVGEGAVTVVAPQLVHARGRTGPAAFGDEHVHQAVVVVIHPNGTVVAPVGRVAQAALVPGEGAVAVVQVVHVGGHV